MKDTYQAITDRILSLLDAGVVPWQKPWRGTDFAPRNPYTGTVYTGINAVLLVGEMLARGYDDPRFATFNGIKQAGGFVRKGEHGIPLIRWIAVYEKDDDGKPTNTVSHVFPTTYTVFNIAAQTASVELEAIAIANMFEPIERCEQIVAGMPLRPAIAHNGGNKAYYAPSSDSVHMPQPGTFVAPERYYSTLFHELAHSTGAEHRLARPGVVQFDRFGSKQYSREELIAEITAAMLCGEAGIETATIEQSASYIANWRKALSEDKKLVVEAARDAQEAADFILAVESETTPESAASL